MVIKIDAEPYENCAKQNAHRVRIGKERALNLHVPRKSVEDMHEFYCN